MIKEIWTVFDENYNLVTERVKEFDNLHDALDAYAHASDEIERKFGNKYTLITETLTPVPEHELIEAFELISADF